VLVQTEGVRVLPVLGFNLVSCATYVNLISYE
jgi:hypothetical protein